MYDLNNKFVKFYNEHVVLSFDEQQSLREKRDINIARLKEGLTKYNLNNNTNYKIVETKTQGSMAMHTVTQSDSNEYDIDIAVIFDTSINALTSIGARRMVLEAFKLAYNNFKQDPEVKTNCVRIYYAEGYHIDLAVYRRDMNEDDEYIYEHAGTKWSVRDPLAINIWFAKEVKIKSTQLPKTVRLSKMFCKSRSHWDMPGGFIQTALCVECFNDSERLDECFYDTIVAIRDRLKVSSSVNNPTDTSQSILKPADVQRMKNWETRLTNKINKLQILFVSTCTEQDAIEAWAEFFDHSYWNILVEANSSFKEAYFSTDSTIPTFRDTEQFIEDRVPMDEQYNVKIICETAAPGFRPMVLSKLFQQVKRRWIPHGTKFTFYAVDINVPSPYNIYWKVRNVGPIAERRNEIRGQIIESNKPSHVENAIFHGSHYVECYIIKNGKCVAIGRIDVPIDTK